VKAIVADQQVAAAAKDKERHALRAGKPYRGKQIILAANFNKPAGRAANPERGVLRQCNILLNRHAL
jgi:hypothetical protein